MTENRYAALIVIIVIIDLSWIDPPSGDALVRVSRTVASSVVPRMKTDFYASDHRFAERRDSRAPVLRFFKPDGESVRRFFLRGSLRITVHRPAVRASPPLRAPFSPVATVAAAPWPLAIYSRGE